MAPAAKWEDGEVTVLITIYGEHFASLEKMAKKKPIYVKMAEKLKEQGYNRSDKQVAKKVRLTINHVFISNNLQIIWV